MTKRELTDFLQNKEMVCRSVFSEMTDGIFIVNLNGVIVDCNKAVLRMYDVDRNECVGRSIYDFMASTDHKKIREEVARLIEKGNIHLEVKGLKNNEIFDMEIKASLLKDDSGRPCAYFGVIRDVTEHKKIEQDLQQSEQKFRGLVEDAAVAVAITDLRGRLTYVNKSLADMLGYTVSELAGSPWKDFIDPRDRGRVVRLFLRIILLRRKPRSLDFRMIRKDGSIVTVMSKPTRFLIKGKTVGFQAIIVDISERRKIEDVLRENEEKLRRILASSPDAITVTSLDGNIIDCNEATLTMHGFSTKEELLGNNALELIAPKDHSRATENMKNTVKQSSIKNVEYTLLKKNGGEFTGELSASMVLDSFGHPTCFVAITKDISERKKMEEELRENKNRYRTLIDNLPQKVFLKDRNLVYLSCNDRYAKDLKIKSFEIRGKTDYDFFPRELAEKYRADDRRIMGTGKMEDIEEDYFQNGEKVFVHTVKTPVKDEKDNTIGILGIFWDITEHKKMEEALRESEEKYRGIVENSPSFIGVLQDGLLKYVNKAMCEKLGWTFEEMTASSFNLIEKIVPQRFQALVQGNMMRRLKGENIPPYEIDLITRDGLEISVIVRNQRILYNGKPAIGLLLIDIAERKKLEAEKLEIMGRVARGVGHDLRNPLTTIRTATSILRDNISEEGQKTLDLIDRAITSADRAIYNLIDFQTELNPLLKEADTKTIIEETLSEIMIPENVKVNISYGDIPQMKMDTVQMKRALSNMILNAVQAMSKGGELMISTSKINDFVNIVIRDTGVGITAENLKRLFTPFYTTKSKGIGLGLVNSKRVVEQHGGTIKVESQEGRGTTFMIYLPIHR